MGLALQATDSPDQHKSARRELGGFFFWRLLLEASPWFAELFSTMEKTSVSLGLSLQLFLTANTACLSLPLVCVNPHLVYMVVKRAQLVLR